MGVCWEWLRPVVSVPFVPTLGPVHPSAVSEEVFADVVAAASTPGRFLPYDKDARWFARKDERVLAGDVVHAPDATLIPTLSARGGGLVRVYLYSLGDADLLPAATAVARRLAAGRGAGVARVVRFSREPQPGRGTRIHLVDFQAAGHPAPDGPVRPHDAWPEQVQGTFAGFAQAMAADGFAFLYRRMRSGGVGPVLTAVVDGAVVGAIGPMEIRPDAVGSPQLLPQYFGVLPDYRGQGLGRLLWRAAMHWGHTHGAAYQLLQTEVGGASDRLCRSEGLVSLGCVDGQRV